MRIWPILLAAGLGALVWGAAALWADSCGPESCADEVPYEVSLPMDTVTWRPTNERTAGREPEPAGWDVREGRLWARDGGERRPARTPDVPVPDTVEDRTKLAPSHVASHIASNVASHVADVVTISPSEAWAVGTVTTHVCCDRWSHHREVVMRWDGHRWHLEDLGLRGVELSHASADGNGGVWVTAQGGDGRVTMLHERGGRWTQSPVRMPQSTSNPDITALNGDRLAVIVYGSGPEASSRTVVLGPDGG